MAWVVRTYVCGDEECGKQFEMFQDRDEGPPKFCPECGAEVDPEAAPIPSRIAIGGSAIARSTDSTYRQLEESSAARAAELDAPSLKITNLKDNLREGDVAAKAPPDNIISRFDREAEMNGRRPYTGWGGGYASPGARVAPVISTGTPGAAYVGPGHMALAAAQPEHDQRVTQIISRPTHQPFAAGVSAKLPRAR
jgi:hypothetical protein